MTTKEYLSRASYINQRIRSKAEQIAEMKTLATKVNAALCDVRVQTSRNNHRMEDIMIKVVEYQEELCKDMEELMRIKSEVKAAIDTVDSNEYRFLLEARYLQLRRWEQIAVEMELSIDQVYHIHRNALNCVSIPAV